MVVAQTPSKLFLRRQNGQWELGGLPFLLRYNAQTRRITLLPSMSHTDRTQNETEIFAEPMEVLYLLRLPNKAVRYLGYESDECGVIATSYLFGRHLWYLYTVTEYV